MQAKNIIHIALILVFTILIGGNCKKGNHNPKERLPPETQRGANTFGCLVDGKAFLPKGSPFAGPVTNARYPLVNGRQFFGIAAKRSDGNRRDGNTTEVVDIRGDSIKVYVGIFELAEAGAGRFTGGYKYSGLNTNTRIQYRTTSISRGQLTITKFDTVNRIVSGRFWFDARDTVTGKIVQVREGRFDMTYY